MIEIRNVTKSYDKIKAVDDVSVSIKENTVFGLIGTNGAGKSTVLRMVAGVLEPEKGEIAIDGLPVFDNMEAKKRFILLQMNRTFLQTATQRTCKGTFAAFIRNLQWRIFIITW